MYFDEVMFGTYNDDVVTFITSMFTPSRAVGLIFHVEYCQLSVREWSICYFYPHSLRAYNFGIRFEVCRFSREEETILKMQAVLWERFHFVLIFPNYLSVFITSLSLIGFFCVQFPYIRIKYLNDEKKCWLFHTWIQRPFGRFIHEFKDHFSHYMNHCFDEHFIFAFIFGGHFDGHLFQYPVYSTCYIAAFYVQCSIHSHSLKCWKNVRVQMIFDTFHLDFHLSLCFCFVFHYSIYFKNLLIFYYFFEFFLLKLSSITFNWLFFFLLSLSSFLIHIILLLLYPVYMYAWFKLFRFE